MSFNWTCKKKYWLVFCKSDHRHLSKILNKKIGHCYVITNDGFNWSQLNPRETGLEWTILNLLPSFDYPRGLTKSGHKVIEISMAHRMDHGFLLKYALLNCVLLCKYAIGLKIKALTPYRLYKKLCQMHLCEMPPYGIDYIKIIA